MLHNTIIMISYKLTDDVVLCLKGLSEMAGEKYIFLNSLSKEHREAIHRYARISTIGASTRIENAILTDIEIDWLDRQLIKDGRPTSFASKRAQIENKLSKEHSRSVEEVAGCRGMMSIVYNQARELIPLTESNLRGLHKELLQFYPKAAKYLGRYKIAPNSVVEITGTGIKRDILKTAEPGSITSASMHELVNWYNKSLPVYPWSVAVAAEFVFRFLAIHPFQDGNGRIGRALFVLALLQSGDKNLSAVIPYVALDRHIEKRKEEYYLALKSCSNGKFCEDSKKYKIHYFLSFLLKVLKEAIGHDIDFYAAKHNAHQNFSSTAKTVLACFEEHPERKLSTKDIIQQTRLPRRTAIYSIGKLAEAGFLQKYGKGAATEYQLVFF